MMTRRDAIVHGLGLLSLTALPAFATAGVDSDDEMLDAMVVEMQDHLDKVYEEPGYHTFRSPMDGRLGNIDEWMSLRNDPQGLKDKLRRLI